MSPQINVSPLCQIRPNYRKKPLVSPPDFICDSVNRRDFNFRRVSLSPTLPAAMPPDTGTQRNLLPHKSAATRINSFEWDQLWRRPVAYRGRGERAVPWPVIAHRYLRHNWLQIVLIRPIMAEVDLCRRYRRAAPSEGDIWLVTVY